MNDERAEDAPIPFGRFLETVHPSLAKDVSGVWKGVDHVSNGVRFVYMTAPDLRLHCATCDGERTFRSEGGSGSLRNDAAQTKFLRYLCGDCRREQKSFSLWAVARENVGHGTVYKYGEHPPFGVPVPQKVLRLFGRDSTTFLKGRQCENQGLGIGAFAYYRRVVENHKNEIFDEIIRVCEALKAPPKLIEELGRAKDEVSFTKAVEEIKTALPDGLLIDGQNPLTALYGALSGGLHNESDSECLEAANAVRLVLTDLVEKMSSLRQDKAELNKAVQLLVAKKSSAP